MSPPRNTCATGGPARQPWLQSLEHRLGVSGLDLCQPGEICRPDRLPVGGAADRERPGQLDRVAAGVGRRTCEPVSRRSPWRILGSARPIPSPSLCRRQKISNAVSYVARSSRRWNEDRASCRLDVRFSVQAELDERVQEQPGARRVGGQTSPVQQPSEPDGVAVRVRHPASGSGLIGRHHFGSRGR